VANAKSAEHRIWLIFFATQVSTWIHTYADTHQFVLWEKAAGREGWEGGGRGQERKKKTHMHTHKEMKRVRDEFKSICTHAHTHTHKHVCNEPSAGISSKIRPLSSWAMARPCRLQVQVNQSSLWVISILTRWSHSESRRSSSDNKIRSSTACHTTTTKQHRLSHNHNVLKQALASYMLICVYVYISLWRCRSMHVYIYIYMYNKYTCIFIYTYIHICIYYIYIYVFICLYMFHADNH
jgi:hypothetical protein